MTNTVFGYLRYTVGLVAILIAIGWVGLHADPYDRLGVWLCIMGLMVAFAVLAGYGATGHWRGILIDSRNKMSLSRLQILVWTLIVLSALLTAILTNIALGWESPLDIVIPQNLLILMGISTGAVIGTPMILANKAAQPATKNAITTIKEKLNNEDIVDKLASQVVCNKDPKAARWGDLLKGDEVGNAASIDVGKLQMFFFTFILALGYCAAIAELFKAQEVVTSLPEVQEGMNVLLGISQTGYLAIKAVPSTTPAQTNSEKNG